MKWIVILLIGALNSARADAPKVPDKPDPNGFEVTIKSVKLDYVKLRKLRGDTAGEDDAMSQDKVLIFTLTITNRGQREQAYKTFNGAKGGSKDYASLIDSKRKFVPLADFGELRAPGVTAEATLKPGESITDVLCFGKPANDAKPMVLLLPAKNHGGAGLWRLDVKVEPTLEEKGG